MLYLGASTAIFEVKKETALFICIIITLGVMVVEITMGYFANSLMLISDGLHMLSHAASLIVSLMAIYISKNLAESDRLKVEARAALINGFSLVFFIVYLVYESVIRLMNPESLEVMKLLSVAVIGLITNLLTAFILARSGVEDLNTKSAYLHMLADTFSSIAIVVGSIVIYYTNWFALDPILSIVVAAVIAKWSYGLIRDALKQLKTA